VSRDKNVDTLDDLRVIARARASKRRLIFWIIFMILVLALCGLIRTGLFGVKHITLTASPGETITMPNVPSAGTSHAKLGNKAITIGSRYEGSSDFRGFLCKDRAISVNWSIFERNDMITVKNDCSEILTIDLYSYAFRPLDGFFDASNGQLRTDSDSD
jgi:hypothetical protein